MPSSCIAVLLGRGQLGTPTGVQSRVETTTPTTTTTQQQHNNNNNNNNNTTNENNTKYKQSTKNSTC